MKQFLTFSMFLLFLASCSNTQDSVTADGVVKSAEEVQEVVDKKVQEGKETLNEATEELENGVEDGKEAINETTDAIENATSDNIVTQNKESLKTALAERVEYYENTNKLKMFDSNWEKQEYINDLIKEAEEKANNGEFGSQEEALKYLEERIAKDYQAYNGNVSEVPSTTNDPEEESEPVQIADLPETSIIVLNSDLSDLANIDQLNRKSELKAMAGRFDDDAVLYVYRKGAFQPVNATLFIGRNLSALYQPDLKFVAPLQSYEKSNYKEFIKRIENMSDSCNLENFAITKGNEANSIKAIILGKSSDVEKFEECWNSIQ